MFAELSADYGRIEAAIHYLEENFQAQPTLAEIASHVGLSEYHFQRLLKKQELHRQDSLLFSRT